MINYLTLTYDADKVENILPNNPNNAVAFTKYNLVQSQTVDERAGTYTVVETYLYSQRPYTEDFTVTTTKGIQRTTISIEGTIQGLYTGVYDVVLPDTANSEKNGKWQAAETGWATVKPALYARAKAYCDDSEIGGGTRTLNPLPLNYSTAFNPKAGTITYSYEYDTRPSACLSNANGNALMTTVTVTNQNQADIFAKRFVPGRQLGPILQNINTKSEKRRQVVIEAMFIPSDGCVAYSDQPNTNTFIQNFNPKGANAGPSNGCYKDGDEEVWVPSEGRYTRTVSWTYE